MESLLEAILAEQKEAKEDRAKLAAQVEKLSAIVARTPEARRGDGRRPIQTADLDPSFAYARGLHLPRRPLPGFLRRLNSDLRSTPQRLLA